MADRFHDRQDAGRQLAEQLTGSARRTGLLVLALPRGGVVLGYQIARRLQCPLDVLLVRKLGCPGNPELAAGAISETGTRLLNEDVIASLRIDAAYLAAETARQQEQISRRLTLYRDGARLVKLADRTVLLVDDGVATGATMKAAIATLQHEGLNALIAAVPVAPPDTAQEIAATVDAWVCLQTPTWFGAVGQFYDDFDQVSDAEVVALLRQAQGVTPSL
jgi:putative phosphoribosyl transferase